MRHGRQEEILFIAQTFTFEICTLFSRLSSHELEEFKRICQDIGTTPTTEIKKFVRTFCDESKIHN